MPIPLFTISEPPPSGGVGELSSRFTPISSRLASDSLAYFGKDMSSILSSILFLTLIPSSSMVSNVKMSSSQSKDSSMSFICFLSQVLNGVC